jgi:protein-S-isoprenylcysteine O-methyltransferase Ste14
VRRAPDTDIAGVVTHPPLIYLAGLLLGLAFEYFWPMPILPSPEQYFAGALLILLGLVGAGPAARAFLKAGTGLPTDRATTVLVTSGPYRFSRNPIYLGLTLAYLGVAAAVDSLWIVGMLAAILPVMHYGVILREERYLERKFGEEYRRFCARVRRWI